MPIWLNIALWIIWTLWLTLEILVSISIHWHNSNRSRVLFIGEAMHNSVSITRRVAFIIFNTLWFCYQIFGN